MKRTSVDTLKYITAIRNLPSLMQHGILSHHMAAAHGHESIANDDVQRIRAAKFVNGACLHDYANLYFRAKNGMMSAVRDRDVCVLTVDLAVIDLDGVHYSDMNAAKGEATIVPCGGDFDLIERDQLYVNWYGDKELMAYTQAEVLIPNVVPARFFRSIVVDTHEKKARVEALLTGLPVIINGGWFF